MQYPPPAAGRFDCVETHGLRPCRRLRRRACGLPPAHLPSLCTTPGPRPSKLSPSAAPSPKAKTLPPPAAGRFDCVETRGLRPCRRLRRRACGPPSAHSRPPHIPALRTFPPPAPPSDPFPPTQSLPICPRFPPCPHPIAPNFPQHCKLSVNTLRTYVLFRRHMLQ